MSVGMANMVKFIGDSLAQTGLKVSYIKRTDDTKEAVVFNYIEMPLKYGDLKEIATQYTVLINVYSKINNIGVHADLVKKAMEDSGFKKITITNPIEGKNNIYNTAIKYKIGKVN